MASSGLGAVLHQFHRLFAAGTVSGMTESQLLARFVETRDEAAFEALVARYGPMVLGVCRQALSDPHLVDDAFQATFLVLVKRARSIRNPALLGNWLYGVALKVSRRARADFVARERHAKEGRLVAARQTSNEGSSCEIDLAPVLHEELARLPEKYRAPMVLCYLDGQTFEEAATRLGWPVGTVKGRVSRAKELLRARLTRRGVTATAALLATTLARSAEASVPPLLLNQTVKAAMVLAAGGTMAGAGLASVSAVALADGVNTTMMISKGKLIALGCVSLITLATATAVVARQVSGKPGTTVSKTDEVKPAGGVENEPTANEQPVSTVNLENLLKGAAPIGDIRLDSDLLDRRLKAARQDLDVKLITYEGGTTTVDRVLQSIASYYDALVDSSRGNAAAEKKAQDQQIQLLNQLLHREEAKYKVGQSSLPNVAEIAVGLEESKVRLAKARAQKAKTPVETTERSEAGGGELQNATPDPLGSLVAESDDKEGDAKILAALEKPATMEVKQVPLEDFLKMVSSQTMGNDLPKGAPVYLDASQLNDLGQAADSPISISLDGIKLKTQLRLALKPLGLGYFVKHGLIIVTSLTDEDYRDATQPGWRAREAAEALQNANGGGGFGGGAGGGGGGFR